jgi:hypothetical protein
MQQEEQDVITVLRLIKKAWAATCADYGCRRLNSERALQASFYHQLRSRLDKARDGYVVFVEAAVKLPSVAADPTTDTAAATARTIVIDTLICKGNVILAAMELKYAPRGFPSKEKIRKDLFSLSHIRNHVSKKRRVSIIMSRQGETLIGDPLELTISRHAKMLLGLLCKERNDEIQVDQFWQELRPTDGPWKNLIKKSPKKLGLCLAYAPRLIGKEDVNKNAMPRFLGLPFEL